MNKKRKIRVLRIIGECKTGGTETIALNYYHYLNHDNIDMDFLFYGSCLPRFRDTLSKYGDTVYEVTDYTDNLIKSTKEIKNIVENGKYDIVHAQLNALNFFPLLGSKLGGAKIRIAANHSTANLKYEFKKSIVKYLIKGTTKWMATNYAACSEYAGVWCYGKKAFAKNKIKIIHNAIDLSLFTFSKELRKTVREKENWEDKFVIGHAGRFTEQKNHEYIIDIFYEIQKQYSNSLLVLIGEGHLLKRIKQKVVDLGIENKVKFLGVRFNINELMQGMDVFLFPSLYEGLGNVITEAQAVGLHSIVSDVIPKEVKMTELVDFLSLNDSASTWATAVLKYVHGYTRIDTHKDLSKAGYEIKSAAKDLEEYYYSLVCTK